MFDEEGNLIVEDTSSEDVAKKGDTSGEDDESDEIEDLEGADDKSEDPKLAKWVEAVKGKTPEEIAVMLRKNEQMMGRQSEEIGKSRQSIDALRETVQQAIATRRSQTSDQDSDKDENYPTFPLDESGVPKAPAGYWTGDYYKTVRDYFLDKRLEHADYDGDEEEARRLARLDATDFVEDKKREYQSYCETLKAKKSESQTEREQSQIRANVAKLQPVIDSFKESIAKRIDRLGYDPDSTNKLVVAVAAQIIDKALKSKDPNEKISKLKASDPATVKNALRLAWDHVQEEEETYSDKLYADPDKADKADRGGVVSRGRTSSSSSNSRQTSSSSNGYSKRHIIAAQNMGMTPQAFEKEMGKRID